MGLAAASFAGGPGKKRSSPPYSDSEESSVNYVPKGSTSHEFY